MDDGSKDHTYSIIQSEIGTHPRLEVVTKANGGHGSSILFGYKKHSPPQPITSFRQIPTARPARMNSGFLGRKRFLRYPDWLPLQPGRRFFPRCRDQTLKAVVRLFFHVSIEDANTPFRLMSAASLRNIIDLVPKDYFLTNVLLSVIYTKKRHPCDFSRLPSAPAGRRRQLYQYPQLSVSACSR